MPPVLLISVFFIRLAYALQATPFDKRNVTQVDARMYVNLPDQTPSDAIVYTYDKEEYDILPKPSGVFMFDYKQIYKYNIDTLKIPKDSTILNKPKYKLLLPKSIKITIFIVFILLISIGIYVVYKFIAERKKSTRNKQLYEKAKEREKLKTDFIVNMSHELRTPLNVILSTSKVTELKINNNDYDNKYLLEKLEQINKNSNRLLKLVNNLIDITKFELGSYELKLENLNIVEVERI